MPIFQQAVQYVPGLSTLSEKQGLCRELVVCYRKVAENIEQYAKMNGRRPEEYGYKLVTGAAQTFELHARFPLLLLFMKKSSLEKLLENRKEEIAGLHLPEVKNGT